MKRIFIVAIAASLLVSCSSKENSLDEPSLWSRPLEVQSSLLNDMVATRTDIKSGEMGVFRVADNTKGYTALNNVKYAYGTTSWSTSAPIYLSGKDATIIGYYPYKNATEYSNYAAIPLTSRLSAIATDKELCYQKTTANGTSSTVNFAMTYAYAKLTLKIKRTTYLGVGYIGTITIKNTEIRKTGTLDMSATVGVGAYASSNKGDLTLSISGGITVPVYSSANDIKTVDIMMIPCTLTNGKFSISLSVDGLTITGGDLTLASLEPAKQYTYNLEITGTATGFAAVKCTDWDVVTPPVLNPIIN